MLRRLLVLALALSACGPAGEIDGRLFVPGDAALTDTSTPTPSRDGGVRDAGASPTCPAPTLASIREKVFLARCGVAGCHVAPRPASNLDLTLDLAALRTRLAQPATESTSGLLLVRPGQVGASFLYLKVFLESPPAGARMPKGGELERCQLEGLRDWIADGAP